MPAESKSKNTFRNLIISGLIIYAFAIFVYYDGGSSELFLLVDAISLIFFVIGSAYWCRYKNRSLWFCLWLLLAPVGLLGILFLKDKSIK